MNKLLESVRGKTRQSRIQFVILCAAVIAMLFLILFGCAKQEQSDIIGCHSLDEAERIVKVANIAAKGTYHPVAATGSMGEFLSEYEIALVVYAWDRIKVGQLVVRNIDGRGTIHKVVYQDGNNFKTAGIATRRSDSGWLTSDNYVGTYIGRILYDPIL